MVGWIGPNFSLPEPPSAILFLMRLRSSLALLLVPALLLVACKGDDDDATPTSSSSASGVPQTAAPSTATPTVEIAPTGGGPFTGGTNPVTATPPSGLQQAVITNVRAAAQPGFDRLVFEFNGNQVPGYSVKYGQSAIACGSGQDQTVFVGGGSPPAALLLIDIRPAAAHDQNGNVTAIRDLQPNLATLKRAFGICDFEGVVQYAVALSAQKPFKVSTLQSPPRLVIDIAQ
jgi:hypothetical protein